MLRIDPICTEARVYFLQTSRRSDMSPLIDTLSLNASILHSRHTALVWELSSYIGTPCPD